ncbi:LOW QUALITY PROTEIN: TBC1 domain family member 25-like [Amphiura filiformis]|uniref:LOW QUALITY PROTEIN: TBC1 domain family member 25-like n=1 Tax=Amphiura filiformis TaxID=82378 RepID=UPI003B20D6E4
MLSETVELFARKMASLGSKAGGNRDAIRVQVMKCSGLLQPEYKSFSIDPEITTFEMLQLLLMQAFQLKSEFTISYLSLDDDGAEVYLSLLSDWDLDAAILTASDPQLRLKVDAKPFEGPGILEGWDIISGHETGTNNGNPQTAFVPLMGALFDQVGRTLTKVSSVFQTVEEKERNEVYELPMRPLDDQEFWTFLDPTGRLLRPKQLRLRVYQGGIDHSLRRVVWRHLLNVFPDGLSGKERMEHVRVKSNEYEQLKKKLLNEPKEDFKTIMNMVRKDVLRTDRKEKFYAGGDENTNINKLFNVLATYSLAHPDVSYCQGMSDLASPILYIMQDEAATYLCFCALMLRLKGSFLPDGKAMSVKFLHLTELIRCVDPEFYEYLKDENADDLYFCYRWLLLELKREFAFSEALRMLEVMWSSLPPNPPGADGVELSGPPSSSSPSAFAVDRARFRFSRHHSMSRERLDLAGKTGVLSKTHSMEGEDMKSKECILHEVENEDGENPGKCSCKRRDADESSDTSKKENTKDENEDKENTDSTNVDKDNVDSKNEEQENPENNSDNIDNTGNENLDTQNESELSTQPPTRPAVKPLTLSGHTNSCTENVSESQTSVFIKDIKPDSVTNQAVLNMDSPLAKSDNDSPLESKQRYSSNESSRNNSPSTPLLSDSGSPSKQSNDSSSLYRSNSPPYSSLPGTPPRSPLSRHSTNSSISSASSASVTSSACSSTPRSTPREHRTVLGIFQQSATHTPNSSMAPMSPSERSSRNQSPIKSITPPTSPSRSPYRGLPPPQDFGGGNPFMMFMCLALLLDQRNIIMANRMDYNEMAMLFDRMVRKHNLGKVLHKARSLYADYLQSEAVDSTNTVNKTRVECVSGPTKPLPANGHIIKPQDSLL